MNPAREFAIKAHGEQLYGDVPYVVHLDAVARLARQFGPAAEDIGYLHDTVEDTDVTLEQIRESFGDLAAKCIDLLTDQPGKTRKERKGATNARLAAVAGPEELALKVKVCDRFANVQACVENKNRSLWKVYAKEQPEFRAAAYRPGDADLDLLWARLDALVTEQVYETLMAAGASSRAGGWCWDEIEITDAEALKSQAPRG